MTEAVLLRRRGLGFKSALGLKQWFEEQGNRLTIIRNDDHRVTGTMENPTHVIRWGCTGNLGEAGIRGDLPVLNHVSAIKKVNSKRLFLMELPNQYTPGLIVNREQINRSLINQTNQYVIRPKTHSRGRHLRVTGSIGEFLNFISQPAFSGGWYARPLVNKSAEYRVFIVDGKAVQVSKKIPGNSNRVAWNVAQGATFENVRWDNWPLNVCQLAEDIFPYTGLNFTGIDIMVDQANNPHFIEANSAPTLPFNEDGTPTYRQQCMAKGLMYSVEHNRPDLSNAGENYEGWRKFIHPAIWENHRLHGGVQ